jgi:hypothetical protein
MYCAVDQTHHTQCDQLPNFGTARIQVTVETTVKSPFGGWQFFCGIGRAGQPLVRRYGRHVNGEYAVGSVAAYYGTTQHLDDDYHTVELMTANGPTSTTGAVKVIVDGVTDLDLPNTASIFNLDGTAEPMFINIGGTHLASSGKWRGDISAKQKWTFYNLDTASPADLGDIGTNGVIEYTYYPDDTWVNDKTGQAFTPGASVNTHYVKQLLPGLGVCVTGEAGRNAPNSVLSELGATLIQDASDQGNWTAGTKSTFAEDGATLNEVDILTARKMKTQFGAGANWPKFDVLNNVSAIKVYSPTDHNLIVADILALESWSGATPSTSAVWRFEGEILTEDGYGVFNPYQP